MERFYKNIYTLMYRARDVVEQMPQKSIDSFGTKGLPWVDGFIITYERASFRGWNLYGGFACISFPTHEIDAYNEFFRKHKV